MTTIWFDGHLVPLEECRPSILAHTLHYGVGVFEGIRSYRSDEGEGSVFRLDDHLRRLADSARVCGLVLPFAAETLAQAATDVLAANDMLDGYLRPIAYQDDGKLSGLGSSPPVHVAIIAQRWGAYLGEDGLTKGIRCTISAWRRAGHGAFLGRAKISGQYVGSVLAKRAAVAAGYHEALLCDDQGFVCEGSGENLFLVRDGVLVTPPEHAAILPGITRDSVIHLCRSAGRELGIHAVREEPVSRDRLLTADEVFLTGTAAEVTPVREIDGSAIGNGTRGPVTAAIQAAYFDLVRGRGAAPSGWRTIFSAAVR